ncbi:MAG: FAD-dependent oxidoreductase [Gammaproteobacteria bacterium]|nr:FAD-dependent oxidoreductase [Gammaproteobacteria bacterium]
MTSSNFRGFSEALQRSRHARRTYPFSVPSELASKTPTHIPIVIVGAGPVGLALAKELANHEIPSVVVEKNHASFDASRAVCWSKRTLEILDRLGVAERMLDKGVTWNIGRVYCAEAEAPLYSFDLLPMKAQKFPAFINLQQYYTEEYLVDVLQTQSLVDLRWQHTASGVESHSDHVALKLETPSGCYELTCDYLIAADGCRSAIRDLLGLDFAGRTFEDAFLIADIRMRAPFPAERRFFFNAPFNDGRTALIHCQPDDLWRVDFQLGREVDREGVLNPASVIAKVNAAIGEDIDFEFEWVSIYTFQCRRMAKFVHDRVIFVGDAAHLVSPFGARGANGGIQDVDNLGWKLARVLKGKAPRKLLESYDEERCFGTDENIANSTRATDFMTPKTAAACAFRDAVLELAPMYPFARRLINSGRLSVPCSLAHSSLVTADNEAFNTPGLGPGTVALDAPIVIEDQETWWTQQLGTDFVCLHLVDHLHPAPTDSLPPGVRLLRLGAESPLVDRHGLLAERYDLMPGTSYLFRPDQHIAGRWRSFDSTAIAAAWAKSLAHPP